MIYLKLNTDFSISFYNFSNVRKACKIGALRHFLIGRYFTFLLVFPYKMHFKSSKKVVNLSLLTAPFRLVCRLW